MHNINCIIQQVIFLILDRPFSHAFQLQHVKSAYQGHCSNPHWEMDYTGSRNVFFNDIYI